MYSIMKTVYMYDGVIYRSVDLAIVNGAKSKRECLELDMNESESTEVFMRNGYLVIQDEENNCMELNLSVNSGHLSYADEQNDEISKWYTFTDVLPRFSSELIDELNRTIDRASDDI
jgi:hypothetical protein